jgi:putative Mg2+ transporter-C (MgtC) family protein
MPQLVLPPWESVGLDVLNLAVAYILALPIGWNREREDRSAGLRTFPIVAVAACGFAMVGNNLPGASQDSASRVLQGVITGIGFIGGGAILRDRGAVTGTATAASIWNIGTVGTAVGFGLYHIAVVLSAINLLTLKALTPLKQQIDSQADAERKSATGPDRLDQT